MQTWDLRTLSVAPRKPEILQSARGEGRSIALHLPAGDSLQEHEVHERAYVVVTEGAVDFADAAGASISAGPGFLAVFEPGERHEVRATQDARLLLILAPWPGPGHPGARN
ncbi:MAG: cupin domain-containing protein [Solirubrobacterales bacterium]|nr:cupin domain-containing protein [Solirubrobacterales bacterium]